MWIITSDMMFSLYPEDTVEQTGNEIRITRGGDGGRFVLTFGDSGKAAAGWKKLQDAVRKNYQNVSVYECGAEKTPRETGRGRFFRR